MTGRGANVRQERLELARGLRAEGRTWVEIGVELRRRWPDLTALCSLRHAHGWTQQQVADESVRRWPDQPRSAKEIGLWERWPAGRGRRPSLTALNQLAEIYGCSISDLLVDVYDYRSRDPASPLPSGHVRHDSPVADPGPAAAVGPERHHGGTGSNERAVGERPGWPIPVADAVAARSLAPEADLFDRIARAVSQPRRLDATTAEWLERCLDEHRRVEDEIGSGPLLAVVRAQLSTVVDLAAGATDPITDRFVRLASQYAQFMAWLCNDAGDKAAALGWYDRSHDWALEAGDPDMAATSLSMKAHLAWSVKDPRRAVRLAQAAQVGPITPGVRGMSVQMEARGRAIAGEVNQARRALDEAETLIARASANPAGEPAWLYFYDETWFALQRGMVELDLGDGARARELLTRGLAGLPNTYRRDRAWYQTLLAQAHLLAGDLDAAFDEAAAITPDAVALNRYATETLHEIANHLGPVAPDRGHQLCQLLRHQQQAAGPDPD